MTTPFYEKARNLFLKTQDAQIHKGLQKYPEPFNPMSWTPQELLNHALEESVDLTHYLVGLKEQLDAKDVTIDRLTTNESVWMGQYKKASAERSELFKQLDKQEEYIKQLEQELRYFRSKDAREKEINNLPGPYVYKPVTGDPLSPYGPYVARTDGKPPYFDPDDQ
jgi:hypothetical protein